MRARARAATSRSWAPSSLSVPSSRCSGTRCHTSDLRASVGKNDPGAGQENFPVVLTNRSGRTCTVYGYPGAVGVDEDYAPTRFSNWYSETKRAAEAEVDRAARAYPLGAVVLRIATVYGPGSTEVVGEMARAMQARHMLLIDGGRAIAGLTYVENVVDAAMLALRNPAAPGQAFNVTDGLEITWRRFLGDLAERLGYPPPRLSLPYGAAYGIAYGLEHGYRLIRSLTGLTTSPLLSRQAVHVLGKSQDFSNRKARELLGWEPRVDYPAGLDATARLLREEYLGEPK